MKEKIPEEKVQTRQRKNGFSRFVLILLGLILGVELYLANARGILGEELPMPFGIGAAVVLSGSMEPSLSVGDLILVKKSDELKTGEMVVYQSGHSLIVHRIMELDGDMVVTKGDANNANDKPFERNQIKGIVVMRIPRIGKILQLLKTPLGALAALAAVICLTEVSYRGQQQEDEEELDAIREEIRKLKEEKDRGRNLAKEQDTAGKNRNEKQTGEVSK